MLKLRRSWISAVAAAALALPFMGIAHAAAPPNRMPLRQIPVPSYVQHMPHQTAVASDSRVTATLELAPGNPAGLAARAEATTTPGSMDYHQWLSPSQVLARYGPSPRTVHALLGALSAHGFQAQDAGWVVNATAPASTWEAVLGLKLATVRQDGHRYRVQATAGREPAWMTSSVLGVDGLTTLPPPVATAAKPTAWRVAPTRANAALGPLTGVTPASVTAESGDLVVTATVPGGVNKPTGQPVHMVFTATVNGQADAGAGITPNGSTSTGQQVVGSADSLDGSIVASAYAQNPLSASLDITVYADVVNGSPVSGTASVVIKMPTMTWSGPSTLQALSPANLSTVYSAGTLESAANPAHETIGLYEGEPPSSSMLAALSQFASANGLALSTVSTVTVDTGTPSTGAGTEENMDLQAVEATAPGAHVVVYSDPEGDIGETLNMVAQQDDVSVFSMSVAGTGFSSLAPTAEALSVEGITVIASAGDWGTIAGCGPDPNTAPTMSPPGVCEPADFETVTAVGGTDVSVNQSGQAFYTQAWGGAYLSSLPSAVEAAVLAGYAASGGGYSATQPVPSWQVGWVPASASGKGVPDVALLADPNVAGLEYYSRSGNLEVGGGTSLGSPLLAGWTADLDHVLGSNLGNIAPTFYALARSDPTAFTQAARGDNGAYQITSQDNQPGTWNPITGLGSPNIDAWASFVEGGEQNAAAAPTLTTPVIVPYGGAVTLSAAWAGETAPVYQYWWEDPRDGVWHNSGAYRAGSYSFTPPVPGRFPVVVYGLLPGGEPTPSAYGSVSVVTTKPMVSGLSVVYAGQTVEAPGATVQFTATATDPNGQPLYQFWVHGPNNQWQVVQNYSIQNTYQLTDLAPGSYTIAVYGLDASEVAAGEWDKVYGYDTVVNVGSQVSVSAPATGTEGTALTITADAVNITNPVYQMWVEAPDGTWTQTGAYSHQTSYSFTPTAAGTYTVAVYAKDPYAPSTSQFSVMAVTTVAVSP